LFGILLLALLGRFYSNSGMQKRERKRERERERERYVPFV